ncbi:UNVERIFIED_CONTAM: hypothetical protein Sradi_3988300 [Sesamum radiatum]|uniref:Reverse transcriptase domain-containing protein n=1 Tax=Sesamum radiatum TaxID=300843 RepID=A0AAW2PGW1_SESRA
MGGGVCYHSYISVCINGSAHGFFKGARGLRLGDPMSPYLFVLAMEVLCMILQQIIGQETAFKYHWHCVELSLFQLGFVDDLLLIYEAHDPSIAVFQRGVELFATLSRLHVNPAKSQLILSKAAHHDRTRLLATLGFQEGQLPVKYLGLPLISSCLSLAICKPLLDKIDRCIQGWGRISLSFTAWVQLIKSVLMALNTYWAMVFILPKCIIKEIEKHLQNCLWKGIAGTGYSKVAWPQVCNPIDEGGLGVRDIQSLNLTLMSRQLWEGHGDRGKSFDYKTRCYQTLSVILGMTLITLIGGLMEANSQTKKLMVFFIHRAQKQSGFLYV